MKKWLTAALLILLAGCGSSQAGVSATCVQEANGARTSVVISAPSKTENISNVILKVEVDVDDATKSLMENLDKNAILKLLMSSLNMEGITSDDIQVGWKDNTLAVQINMDAAKLDKVFQLGNAAGFETVVASMEKAGFACE